LHASGWIPVHASKGLTPDFMREENIIAGSECMCGRVSRGETDPSLFFFTRAGSFLTNDVDDLLARATEEQLGPIRGRCIREGFKTVVAVPVRTQDGTIVGVLHLASKQKGRMAPGAAHVLESLLAHAGGTLAASRFAGDRDQELLSSVTRALLPDPPVCLSGFHLGLAHRGAPVPGAVGGDFYDVVSLGPGRLAIIVGDFCGHGLAAAGMAARCRLTLRQLLAETERPADVLARANTTLAPDISPEQFVTAMCIVLDRTSRTAQVAVGGHPAPIVAGAGEARPIDVPAAQVPLGVLDRAAYDAVDVRLKDGQLLVAYTDGLTDSRDSRRSFFGRAQLASLCARLSHRTPREMATELCTASDAFASPRIPTDDKLVLVVRPE